MEKDLSVFDKNVMELFDLCKDILKASEKRNLKMTDRRNPFLSRLEKYIKTYTKTEPSEHVGYFEKIYTDNKRFILLGPQRDAWLLDSSIIISYGEDCGLKTEMKLHLSSIYNTACKLRDEIKEEVEGLPDSSDNIETEYPSKYLLYLYRIFGEITSSDNEKTKLSSHIETLESAAGIRSSRSNNDPLSGLFDMAANMAEQVSGSKISRDKMPGKNDFGKMLGDMMSDPKTKSMLGNVMQSFQGAEGVGGIVTKLVEGLGASTATAAPSKESANSLTNEKASDSGSVNDEFADF